MVTLIEIKTKFCRMIKRDKRSFIYNKRGKKKVNTHTVTCNNKQSQHQA